MRVFKRKSGLVLCEKLKPYPLEDSLENTGLTDLQWRIPFDHSEECPETFSREFLPLKDSLVETDYPGCDTMVFYFEHGLAVGVLAVMVGLFVTFFSLCWAVIRHDISGGFGAGAYIVSLIALVVTLYLR
jgi:hypothetical protein